jgi:hypothetical protein
VTREQALQLELTPKLIDLLDGYGVFPTDRRA